MSLFGKKNIIVYPGDGVKFKRGETVDELEGSMASREIRDG
jgi:hypothetical protein